MQNKLQHLYLRRSKFYNLNPFEVESFSVSFPYLTGYKFHGKFTFVNFKDYKHKLPMFPKSIFKDDFFPKEEVETVDSFGHFIEVSMTTYGRLVRNHRQGFSFKEGTSFMKTITL